MYYCIHLYMSSTNEKLLMTKLLSMSDKVQAKFLLINFCSWTISCHSLHTVSLKHPINCHPVLYALCADS